MSDDEKPNPIARQSDLDLLRQEQKTEHMKTRGLILLIASPGVLKALPYIFGYFGLGWSWPW